MSGKLVITKVGLELHDQKELLSKIDPYVIFKSEKDIVKTKYINNGGQHASWPNDSFCVKV